MPRERNPNRDKAYELYKEHGGNITNRRIAEILGEDEKVVAVWKQRDKWNVIQQSKKKVVQQSSESCTTNDISWADIENEYVTDIRRKPCTLEQLAKKHDVSISRLMKYAAENGWSDKRRNHVATVKQKTAEKTVDRLSSDIAKVTAKHLRISDQLMAVVEKALGNPDEFYTYVEKLRTGHGPGEFSEEITAETVNALNDSKLLNVVNAFEKIQKAQRQTLSILDEKDKQRIDLEKAKVKGDDDPTEDDGFVDALKGKVSETWSDDDEQENS